MMTSKNFLLMITVGLGLGSTAFADGVEYPTFEHKDWQISCDNTRTCRAAGYSPEDAKNRVTVLLTRNAGVGQDVLALVKFSNIAEDDNQAVEMPNKIILRIDNKSYGEIGSISKKKIDNEYGSNPLTKAQTQALLKALKGTSKIAFVGGGKEWVLPGDGAVGVLLKMDDVQGRVGTISALIKKGSQSESGVLPALPKPVVYKKPVSKENPEIWQSKVNWDLLRKELPRGKELLDENFCSLLTDGDNEYQKFDPKVVAVLPHDRLLVSGLCYRAAYNEAYGYWIINQKQPYQPKLITTAADGVVANDYMDNNQLDSSMKGRGIGDCWSRMTWVWDGNNFVKTYDGDTGMCRMIEAGGAWTMPTYVAEVK